MQHTKDHTPLSNSTKQNTASQLPPMVLSYFLVSLLHLSGVAQEATYKSTKFPEQVDGSTFSLLSLSLSHLSTKSMPYLLKRNYLFCNTRQCQTRNSKPLRRGCVFLQENLNK
jgi:hypothetical protein